MTSRRNEKWDREEELNRARQLSDEDFYVYVLTNWQGGTKEQDEEHKRLKEPIRCFHCKRAFSGVYTRHDAAKAAVAGKLVLDTRWVPYTPTKEEFEEERKQHERLGIPFDEEKKEEEGGETKRYRTLGHFPVCWNCYDKDREETEKAKEAGVVYEPFE
jgi:hypothetical protein